MKQRCINIKHVPDKFDNVYHTVWGSIPSFYRECSVSLQFILRKYLFSLSATRKINTLIIKHLR